MKAISSYARAAALPVVLAALVSFSRVSFADPVDVGYTVSGSANDYTLSFSVTNNLNGTNDIYFFGVALPATDIVGSPASWGPYANGDNGWNNAAYGGNSTTYNNVWCCNLSAGIVPGATASGFSILDTADAVAPTSVDWFAFAYGGTWTGGGNFFTDSNPGFQGDASTTVSATPEPSSLMLLGSGFVGLAGALRRKLRA
jgi:hypothetical protein